MTVDRALTAVLLLACLILAGCGGASMREPHEGDLLDEKVLAQRVESALRRGGSDFANVRVEVAGEGSVTLSGTVASADARARAEEISLGVYGVQVLRNDVQIEAVKPPGD